MHVCVNKNGKIIYAHEYNKDLNEELYCMFCELHVIFVNKTDDRAACFRHPKGSSQKDKGHPKDMDEHNWHLEFQEYIKDSCREVVVRDENKRIENRADIKIDNFVIELQDSYITMKNSNQREHKHDTMIWLVNFTSKTKRKTGEKISICRIYKSNVQNRYILISNMSKAWIHFLKKPVYVDTDFGIFRLHSMISSKVFILEFEENVYNFFRKGVRKNLKKKFKLKFKNKIIEEFSFSYHFENNLHTVKTSVVSISDALKNNSFKCIDTNVFVYSTEHKSKLYDIPVSILENMCHDLEIEVDIWHQGKKEEDIQYDTKDTIIEKIMTNFNNEESSIKKYINEFFDEYKEKACDRPNVSLYKEIIENIVMKQIEKFKNTYQELDEFLKHIFHKDYERFIKFSFNANNFNRTFKKFGKLYDSFFHNIEEAKYLKDFIDKNLSYSPKSCNIAINSLQDMYDLKKQIEKLITECNYKKEQIKKNIKYISDNEKDKYTMYTDIEKLNKLLNLIDQEKKSHEKRKSKLGKIRYFFHHLSEDEKKQYKKYNDVELERLIDKIDIQENIRKTNKGGNYLKSVSKEISLKQILNEKAK